MDEEIKRRYDFPSDDFTPYERAQIRELIEAQRNRQWLFKRLGAFLLGGPAIMALWQAGTKLFEWIRGQ